MGPATSQVPRKEDAGGPLLPVLGTDLWQGPVELGERGDLCWPHIRAVTPNPTPSTGQPSSPSWGCLAAFWAVNPGLSSWPLAA